MYVCASAHSLTYSLVMDIAVDTCMHLRTPERSVIVLVFCVPKLAAAIPSTARCGGLASVTVAHQRASQ